MVKDMAWHQLPLFRAGQEIGKLPWIFQPWLSSKEVASQKILLPITIVFSDWYLLNEILVIPDVSKRPIHRSSTPNGIEFSSVRFFTTQLVEEGVISPKEM